MTDIYLYLHNNLLLSKSPVYEYFIQLKNVFKTMLRIYWSIFVSNLIILIMNKFTRKMMLAIACIIAGCINVQAQYQLPNPGFEGTWK